LYKGTSALPERFSDRLARRQWLDFIAWHHGALVDFAEQSLRALLRYFPPEKVRMKPGGSAGGVNPLAWGTYCRARGEFKTAFTGHEVILYRRGSK
jgi:hypothetical protein